MPLRIYKLCLLTSKFKKIIYLALFLLYNLLRRGFIRNLVFYPFFLSARKFLTRYLSISTSHLPFVLYLSFIYLFSLSGFSYLTVTLSCSCVSYHTRTFLQPNIKYQEPHLFYLKKIVLICMISKLNIR